MPMLTLSSTISVHSLSMAATCTMLTATRFHPPPYRQPRQVILPLRLRRLRRQETRPQMVRWSRPLRDWRYYLRALWRECLASSYNLSSTMNLQTLTIFKTTFFVCLVPDARQYLLILMDVLLSSASIKHARVFSVLGV